LLILLAIMTTAIYLGTESKGLWKCFKEITVQAASTYWQSLTDVAAGGESGTVVLCVVIEQTFSIGDRLREQGSQSISAV